MKEKQKKYKDTVFRLLYSEPSRALSLYNSISDTEYDDPSLELKVTVLNINSGMNETLKEKCPSLREYMIYVEKVRTYAKEMELEEAVERAVDECIDLNILRDFLIAQRAEVVKMSIYEYDEEREMKLIREDERELGREEGRNEGRGEIIMLLRKLFADRREDDLRKVLEDEGYCRQLCEEYNIS